jgi:hypothetical protein
MRRRLPVAINLVLATGLAWVLLGVSAGHTAGQQVVTIAAPAFVGLPKSTHNDGNPSPPDACGAQQPLTNGDEHFGDLNAAKGSYVSFVRLPDHSSVSSFSLYANDFDSENVHAFLVRKRITPGTHLKENGYVTMATAESDGAVDSTIRKFTDATINGPRVNNTDFEYCGATEPFAVQLVVSTA